MNKIYTVNVEGTEIEYGALVTRSRFSDVEWFAICLEMMRQERPDLYDERKNDKKFVLCLGWAIDLEQRYEALLELLPQTAYSKAGTHPKWVADAVEEETLNKGITQDDVEMLSSTATSLDELISSLGDYFGLEQKSILGG